MELIDKIHVIKIFLLFLKCDLCPYLSCKLKKFFEINFYYNGECYNGELRPPQGDDELNKSANVANKA
jgi:hypothetical protein